ncbi:hypothetical protein BT69DRAFT_1291865 [Atractiella rhizophila]|nr:hypothetical protein BT69DRAFT_1291865 [Atractiella rhizophila]
MSGDTRDVDEFNICHHKRSWVSEKTKQLYARFCIEIAGDLKGYKRHTLSGKGVPLAYLVIPIMDKLQAYLDRIRSDEKILKITPCCSCWHEDPQQVLHYLHVQDTDLIDLDAATNFKLQCIKSQK